MRHILPALAVGPSALMVVLSFSTGTRALAADPPKGLVLHWNMDKSDTAGAIADSSGQNNSGKASDASWTSTGKKGGGYDLTPDKSSIRVAGSPSLTLKQATFSIWFKVNKSDPNPRRLLNRGKDGSFSLRVGGDPKDAASQGKLVAWVDNRPACMSDKSVADGLWHNATVVCDGKELRLYVDGEPQKQVVPCAGSSVPGTGDLTIGLAKAGAPAAPGEQAIQGSVDEIMAFNRPLDAAEIKSMVTAIDPNPGKPKFTKSQVAGRLRQLKLLYEEGLLTDEFYAERVKECEVAE